MKKLFVTIIILISLPGLAQTQLGLKFSPSVNFFRYNNTTDSLSFDTNGGRFSFVFGPFADFYFAENYFFQTGILYAPKTLNLSVTETQSANLISDSEVNLNYMQVPLSLKLFTDEFTLDQRFFFLIGGQTEFLVNQPEIDADDFIQEISFIDLSYYLGAGWEYRIGLNTRIFASITYSGGLINLARTFDALEESFAIRSRLVSLDLGLKF